jgi:hypothetical protein
VASKLVIAQAKPLKAAKTVKTADKKPAPKAAQKALFVETPLSNVKTAWVTPAKK